MLLQKSPSNSGLLKHTHLNQQAAIMSGLRKKSHNTASKVAFKTVLDNNNNNNYCGKH